MKPSATEWKLLTIAALVAAAFVACGALPESPRQVVKVKRTPGPAFVASTVTLPSGDGRVHIVTIPGRYGSADCAVLVSTTGSNIACPAPIETDAESATGSTGTSSGSGSEFHP